MTDKKSPLEDCLKVLQNMTPEEHEKWAKDVQERLEQRKKEEELLKNTPPSTKTATCRCCGGRVIGEYVKWYSDRLGDKSFSWEFKGYHCEGCGLIYKFLPNSVL